MTAYIYGYNCNGYTTYQATKSLITKQTNVYEQNNTLSYFQDENEELPRRIKQDNIYEMIPWFVNP